MQPTLVIVPSFVSCETQALSFKSTLKIPGFSWRRSFLRPQDAAGFVVRATVLRCLQCPRTPVFRISCRFRNLGRTAPLRQFTSPATSVQNATKPDPKKLWDVRPLLKKVLVEAPGIEPGSENYDATCLVTCVFGQLILSRIARTDALAPGLVTCLISPRPR